MTHVSKRALLLAAGIVIAALLVVLGVVRCTASSGPSPSSLATPSSSRHPTPVSGLPTIAVADLPPEARATLVLIDRGGPFKYSQDNTVFGNFEGLLPTRARGYYHEYTVVTPGSPDRGTRRLIAGRDGDIYYTDDHYASFRQVIR